MVNRGITIALVWLLLGIPAWSRVLVRWTEPSLPARALGVADLVIAFDANNTTLLQNVAARGYHVYVEVPLQQAADAATRFSKQPVAGLIINPGRAQDAGLQLQKLRAAHPKMQILLLSPDGKQPQMRGQTVTTRDGVLQVSSATAQPWLDSNLAMIRYEKASDVGETPVYSFDWELNDSLQQANGPSTDDYALAIAESGAIHADLVLNLHQTLQKDLIENQPAAWASWNKLLSYLKFADAEPAGHPHEWSNVGVLMGDYDAAYEPMNLMARHNIPFRVLRGEVSAAALNGLSLVAVFSAPGKLSAEALNAFAKQGGTVILVDIKSKYPWQSVQPIQTAEHALTYAAGKGRVIELSEPVSDPETFAQDVRRLMKKDDVLISLWNALTTIAVPYRDDRSGDLVIDLVNYAEEAMRIQIEVKGSFSMIRYEAPESGCCQELSSVKQDGFTDFVVPSLVVAGRVHLKAGAAGGKSPGQ